MHCKRTLSFVILGACVFGQATPASPQWRKTFPGLERPARQSTALDPHGDILIGGSVHVKPDDYLMRIIKSSRTDGRRLWSRRVQDRGMDRNDSVNALVSDASGDALIGGTITGQFRSQFAVVKLSSRTGAERWRTVLPSIDPDALDSAEAIAVDLNGDVLAAGAIQTTTGPDFGDGDSEFIVIKLSGKSGAELWRYLRTGDGKSVARAVAVDARGDVLALGTVFGAPVDHVIHAVKLDGKTGTEIWRRDVASGDVQAIVLDRTGNVFGADRIRATATGDDFGVFKLSGSTGDVVWQATLSLSDHDYEIALDVATDGDGNVVAAGRTHDPRSIGESGPSYEVSDLTVAKFSGATGSVIWQRMISGSAGIHDAASAVAIDPAADVVVVGTTDNERTCLDFTVMKLAGSSGSTSWSKTIDGTERARVCNPPPLDGPPVPHWGTDRDVGVSVALDPRGYVVATGLLSDFRSGDVRSDLTVVRLRDAPRPTR